MKTTKMSSCYLFHFDLGVPVFDWPTGKKIVSTKWRKGTKRIMAYSLLDAIQKFTKPYMQRHGAQAKLNVISAERFDHDGKTWTPLNLDAVGQMGALAGELARK